MQNCSSRYWLKPWDNWAQKWWFLTHLPLPTITILAHKWPNNRRIFLPTNRTFDGIFFQTELRTCQLKKVTQDLICICKQNTFFTGFIDKFNQTDKALPVKTSKPRFVASFLAWEQALLFGQAKCASRERGSEGLRLVSLAQIVELAHRLPPSCYREQPLHLFVKSCRLLR